MICIGICTRVATRPPLGRTVPLHKGMCSRPLKVKAQNIPLAKRTLLLKNFYEKVELTKYEQ